MPTLEPRLSTTLPMPEHMSTEHLEYLAGTAWLTHAGLIDVARHSSPTQGVVVCVCRPGLNRLEPSNRSVGFSYGSATA
jgi:hypothetical protein